MQKMWAILIHGCTLQVFLEYADVDGSTRAKTGMHGRKFGGNQVVAVFYPENKFAAEEHDG
jgi:splicing factor U2AF 65 kDa subunit